MINLFRPISWSVKGSKHGGGEVVGAGVPHPLAEDHQHQDDEVVVDEDVVPTIDNDEKRQMVLHRV